MILRETYDDYNKAHMVDLIPRGELEFERLGKLVLLDHTNRLLDVEGNGKIIDDNVYDTHGIYNIRVHDHLDTTDPLRVSAFFAIRLNSEKFNSIFRYSSFKIRESDAHYLQSVVNNSNALVERAMARTVRAHALGSFGVNACADNLKELEALRRSVHITVIDSYGIIKNGLGKSKSAMMYGSIGRESLQELKQSLPAGTIPEEATHAASAIKVPYLKVVHPTGKTRIYNNFPEGFRNEYPKDYYTVVGHMVSKKFVSLASVLPEHHPARKTS